MRGRLTILAFAALFGAGSARAAEPSDVNLLVKTRQLTPDLVVAVAKVGQEKTIPAKAGADILKLISQYCGTSNARRYYLPLFIGANADNADVASGKTILEADAELKLPACLYADEKFSEVPVTRGAGPNWELAKPVSPSAIELTAEGPQPVGSPPTRWRRHQPGSGRSIEGSRAPRASRSRPRASGQAVDSARLNDAAATLPDALRKVGPALVAKDVDSGRLEDPQLRSQYEKLVRQTISSAKISSLEDKPNPDVELRASAFERAIRTQDVLASNDLTDFTTLQPGAKLLSSDFRNAPYPITLKQGVDRDEALREIRVATRSNPDVKVETMGDYVPYFGSAQADEGPDCQPPSGKAWPYDFAELTRVLDLRRRIDRTAEAGKVLVLDTGFPPDQIGKAPFDPRYFVNDRIDGDDDLYLRTSIPYKWFHPKAKEGSHGVAVLTLALGGVEAVRSGALIDLVRRDNGQVISVMGYRADPAGANLSVNGDSVAPALFGTSWPPANVTGVNLSLRFNVDKTELTATFKENDQVVYVFAAGNNPQPVNLTFSAEQPATFGGPGAVNVVTVGGVAPNDTFWTRSNFSQKYVDVAAPACGVPTLVWNDATKTFDEASLNGTSFAAPLVSFAANLMRSSGAPAWKIKSRLVGSGRYLAALEKKVNGARALDVAVAAAINFDAVRDRDGTLRLGLIAWDPGKSVCGRSFSRRDLVQVQRQDDDPSQVSLAIRNAQRGVDFESCPLGNSLKNLTFKPLAPAGEKAAYGAQEPLDFETVRSVTLCEDACFRPVTPP